MEVTWDKGSSGLVFYTDAAYWDKAEGGGYYASFNSYSRLWLVLVQDMVVHYESRSSAPLLLAAHITIKR